MIINKNELTPIIDAFEVDDEIYPILAVLWDKGYKTNFSCAGHDRFNKAYTIKVTDEEYEKYKNEKNIILVNKEEGFKTILVIQLMTEIYIMFKENYMFDNIPEGFSVKRIDLISSNEKHMKIGKVINFYEQSDEATNSELHTSREKLLTWAKNLPNIKENERKRKIKYE